MENPSKKARLDTKKYSSSISNGKLMKIPRLIVKKNEKNEKKPFKKLEVKKEEEINENSNMEEKLVTKVKVKKEEATIEIEEGGDKDSILSDSLGHEKTSDVPTKVLLLKVKNQKYPISTSVIDAVCRQFNINLVRIVVFGRQTKSVLVELPTVGEAKKAKSDLDGADIYHRCCTLSISFSRLTKLDVYKNDEITWDYTNEEAANLPLGQRPFTGWFPAGGGYFYGNPYGMMNPWYRGPPCYGPSGSGGMLMGTPSMITPSAMMGGGFPMMMPPSMATSGSVLLLHGLDPERMNCQRMFNIFCVYGNVIKVKFLLNKSGAAFIQMGSPQSAEQAISSLNGTALFDNKLSIKSSHNFYLNDVFRNICELTDGSPSQVDYSDSPHNRFTTHELAVKNRVQKPSKVLHYYSAPVDFDKTLFFKICGELRVDPPEKFFVFKNKSERSGSGLMEFLDEGKALECLCAVNHYKIDRTDLSRYPFILKLCYSTSSYVGTSGNKTTTTDTKEQQSKKN